MTLDDFKKLGDEFLFKARENLMNDGHLLRVAFIFKNEAMFVVGLIGDSDLRDIAHVFCNQARTLEADVVMVLADAWTKFASREEYENMRHGDLENDPERRECIVISMKGPNVAPISQCWPYRRDADNKPVFDAPPSGWLDVEINAFPDYWR